MDRTNGFDAVAWYYDRLARIVFGKSICRSQTCFLSTLSSTSNILVLGGGTGWWLKEFLQKKPGCRILYVDASPAMLNLAKKAVGDDKRITFRLGTENLHATEVFLNFDFEVAKSWVALLSKLDAGRLETLTVSTEFPNPEKSRSP